MGEDKNNYISPAEIQKQLADYEVQLNCSECGLEKRFSFEYLTNDICYPFVGLGQFVCSNCLCVAAIEIVKK